MNSISFFFGWEVLLIEFLQRHMGSFGLALAKGFTFLGDDVFTVLVIVFLYWIYDKRVGRRTALIVMTSCAWNPMVKNLLLRRRPYFDHAQIRNLCPVEPDADLFDIARQGYSLPSGHSQNAAAVFGSLCVHWKKLRPFLWIAPVLVGLSRVSLGVHYPTDVLGGWALGLISLGGILWLEKAVKREWLVSLIAVLSVLPGLIYCKTSDYFTCCGLLLGFVLGSAFEKRFVRFRNTRKPVRMILRPAVGMGLFLALSELMKLPFSAEFLASGGQSANLVRLARYGMTIFLLTGFYPALFQKMDPLFHDEQRS